MRSSAILLISLLVACIPAGRIVHYVATTTEVGAYGSLACDAGSTHRALEMSGRFHETNPVMGPRPDDARLAEYFGSIGVGVAGFNRALSLGRNKLAGDLWRIAVNVVMIGIEVDAIRSNTDLGISLCGR